MSESLSATRMFAGMLLVLACLALPVLADQTLVMKEGVTITYPNNWYEIPPMYTNAYQLVNVPLSQVGAGSLSRIIITTEQRTSSEDAINRLGEIAAESGQKSGLLRAAPLTTINENPAIERVDTVPQIRRGLPLGAGERQMTLRVTSAIAFGSLIVRFEGYLPPGADPAVAEEILAISRTATYTPTEIVKAPPALPSPGGYLGLPVTLPAVTGISQRIRDEGNVDSEIEIAVSTDGQDVVIGNNGVDYSVSNNGGITWTRSNLVPGYPHNGDPSLSWGESGNFYFGFISFPDGTPAAGNQQGCANAVGVSTDDGQTFPTYHTMVLCPFTGAGICFPDQEHIAADRSNAGSSGDRIYSTWRNFVPGGAAANCGKIGGGAVTPSIVCSKDGGATWTAAAAVGTGDVPRITVGQDGFVYVIYRSGSNIMLTKFSSCDAGLATQPGFPVTVGSVTDVVCPVSGLDRCNDGNLLSSHVVAVDDTDANHLYVAYATSSGSGNENVMVRDSTDGGLTWPAGRVVQLNTAVTARRFMPWVCTAGGNAWVSWYDRRASTGADNSLTEFYGGQASRDSGGNLVTGAEFLISDIADSMCGAVSGWPCAPRSTGDSESCTSQPQLAGVCCDATKAGCPGSGQRCDFSSTVCPAGETCNGGGGCPKYGDYSGNACAAGRFYTAWASAISPAHITPASTSIDVFFEAFEPGDQPPVAKAGGPYTGTEATAILLDASGSSDPDGDPLQYRWDVDNNGVWERDWSADPRFSYTWNDDFSGSAKVEVSDGILAASATASVTVKNVPPTATFTAPATVNEGNTIGLSLTSPHDPSPVDTAAGFKYAFDCGDGSGYGPFGSASTKVCPTCDEATRKVGGKIRDKDGGITEYTADVEVTNVAPVVDPHGPMTVDEGSVLAVSGSFTDPGCDTWSGTIDYGDGSAVVPLTISGKDFSSSHTYCDNGIYNVIVTINDGDGGIGTGTFAVTVNNVNPAVTPIILTQPNREFILPGQLLNFKSSFADPGSCDTWDYTWKFGDGTPDKTGHLVTVGDVKADHAYAAPGNYQVTIVVKDDDGGSDSESLPIHVADAAEAKHILANYIASLPDSAFKGNAPQRKNALDNMFQALDKKLENKAYQGFIQDLRNNVRSKADGIGEDWITDPSAQQEICQKIDDITTYVATLKK
jgi:hypothetical protein